MALQRSYNLKCDGCGIVHKATCSSVRRARSAAKQDKWGRRKVVVGRDSYMWDGRPKYYDVIAGRDFCPDCLDKMEATNDAS